MYNLTALLPLKANSERVKGKNFRNFAGKPLFKWILETLLSIECIDKIVINTDAKELLNKNGIPCHSKILIRNRKKEICGDHVSMNRIIEDDITNIDSETYLMTHTTNPLLSQKTISTAIETYNKAKQNNSDSLFTVNEFQTRFYKKDGEAVNHDPNNLLRTQDLEPYYEENSNLYIFNKNSFKTTNARIGENPYLFVTPPMESIDIDDMVGWTMAEMVALSQLLFKSQSDYHDTTQND